MGFHPLSLVSKFGMLVTVRALAVVNGVVTIF